LSRGAEASGRPDARAEPLDGDRYDPRSQEGEERAMNWTELLKGEVEQTYRAAEGLMRKVEPKDLAWRPPTGSNWMTTGQLLEHMTTACGACCQGFVTGDWGMPADASEDDMLPAAERMPAAKSVGDAIAALARDKETALRMIETSGESALASKAVSAPWDPTPRPLGRQFLHMVGHLGQHKAQLFYYLKTQGKPVHTGDLYGA
jgi:hypothetical protein